MSETRRQIDAGVKEKQALERGNREKEKTGADRDKNNVKLRAEFEKSRQKCEAEFRRAEKLKGENKHVEAQRERFTAVAEFFMDPYLISGEQLAKVANTITAALELRKKPGHVGESMKMTADARDMLVEKLAEGRYTLRVEADKRLEAQLARQRGEYEVQLKAKDGQIAAETQRRETAERNMEDIRPWREE